MTNGIISTSLDMPWKIALVADEQSSTHDGEESIQCIDDSESDDQSMHHHELSDAKTTLMVRNIPVLYTQEMLLEEWPSDGSWDFLYLPRSNSGAGRFNLTYAFINFASEAHAVAFKEQWHKKRLASLSSKKALNISFAEVQGFEANLAQLKNKRTRWQSNCVITRGH